MTLQFLVLGKHTLTLSTPLRNFVYLTYKCACLSSLCLIKFCSLQTEHVISTYYTSPLKLQRTNIPPLFATSWRRPLHSSIQTYDNVLLLRKVGLLSDVLLLVNYVCVNTWNTKKPTQILRITYNHAPVNIGSIAVCSTPQCQRTFYLLGIKTGQWRSTGWQGIVADHNKQRYWFAFAYPSFAECW